MRKSYQTKQAPFTMTNFIITDRKTDYLLPPSLVSYANATPNGQVRVPRSLQDLLKDPRYPNPHRHLRKRYADPITGKDEWGTVPSLDGTGIIGVYSLSNAKPIKIGNFDVAFQNFEGKTSYRDWQFTVMP